MVSPVSGSNLISYYSGQAALSLLGGSASSTTAAGGSSSATALLSYFEQKEGLSGSSTSGQAATNPAPTAPWQNGGVPSPAGAVQNAVDGQPFINPAASQLNAPAGVSSEDYKNLFALYQGLNTLYNVANAAASASSTSAASAIKDIKPAQLQTAFTSGMSQVENFLSNSPFSEFNLTSGEVNTQEESTVGVPNGTYSTYTTGVIGTGDEAQPLQALQGSVQFNVSVQSKYATVNTTNAQGKVVQVPPPPVNIPIDLTNMGSTPRTIDNVVNFINAQLKSAGVSTTFSAANLGSTSSTTTLPNGQTLTSTGTTKWGLTINGSSGETVSFSAPSTAAAVYVSSMTGGALSWQSASSSSSSSSSGPTAPTQTATATGQQLMKLQTGNDVAGTQPAAITNAGNTSGLPSGAVFADSLPDGVSAVAASATGPDGSVYELANASGTVNNAPIQGGQGVVLLKYDPSGKLLSTKVVGGLQDATGASIAVGADGTVAVAGTNTTVATTASTGLTTPSTTSAFVQVYDPTGNPTWSQTVPAMAGTSTATGVAIGPDDSVYLSGQTTGSVGNQIPHGSQDEFIQGFNSTGAATFTTQYGSQASNTSAGIVYDAANNSLYTAGLENDQTVVRSFALNSTTTGTGVNQKTTVTATAGATRNLGFATGLAGIGLSGSQVVVGGTANAATIHAGTVTQAYKGVSDAFIASIDSSLSPTGTDSVAYLGMSGATQTGTAMTVAGGQAYITGTLANDPSSLAASNATEGFVSGVNTGTGAVSYSTKFPGANGQAVPSAISVSTTGSSVLDQLGLPQGMVNAAQSNLITSATSIQPGSSFWVRTSPGGSQTQIQISATDTLATLATKLNTAIAGQGLVTVVSLGANSQLEITPNSPNSFIELDAQQASNTNPGASSTALTNNALAQLGLNPGVIRQVKQINNLTDVTQEREYGLDLPTNLDISTTASAQHAANALQAAMVSVQKAYQDLATPPTMASEAAAAAKSTSGTVPTYLTNEISNLQAGLSRLTAGESSGTSSQSSSALLASLIA
jgi:hypothetical protein